MLSPVLAPDSPAAPVPSPGRRLRALILTKVFPNALQPLAAAFNRQQFARLAELADLELVVPIQWFPGAAASGKRTEAGKLSALADFEWLDGLFVRHPRVLHLPRLDYSFAAGLYVASLFPLFRRLRGQVDVVVGSFLYPDGVAAVWMARLLGVPAVMYALGSDVNVVPEIPGVRQQLRLTFGRTDRVIAVSRDLADKVIALGAPADRVVVVPNGVDRELFQPRDRAAARRAIGEAESGRLILYVGRIEPAKGIPELLDAFARLAPAHPELKLALVGDGSLRGRCEEAARGLPGRIIVAGPRPLPEVSRWVTASDLLTLPSHNEGTPNVVLEALAAGRPVVATRVGGIPDVLNAPELGALVPPKDPGALAEALLRVVNATHDAAAISARGPVSWAESAARLHDVLQAAVADPLRR